MDKVFLLAPTLHVEVRLKDKQTPRSGQHVCNEVANYLRAQYVNLRIGHDISGYDEDDIPNVSLIESISVVDFTGPSHAFASHHALANVEIDVQSYTMKMDQQSSSRRRISQPDEGETPQARIRALPHITLKDEWDSLIYDHALPSQLLRYLSRMLGVMRQPGLNLSTFNWNRLCLLHGPPGSGKSTLCRALAQKLSIRLSHLFAQSLLVEVDTNSMLSKFFAESGKLIGLLFEKIHHLAQSPQTLVCVVMDEVETIAGSREKVSSGGECNDSLRATNQLLTALDRMRAQPNIIVLCTSNLLSAIDPAFLDRIDIKQYIPCPSPAAIYNIFRSCLCELMRSGLVSVSGEKSSARSTPDPRPLRATLFATTSLSTFSEARVLQDVQPNSPGSRLLVVAQRCEGFSGRSLRRLPVLGLTMYTWGGNCTLQDAITALEAAVDQELKAKLKVDVGEELAS